ncbi:hypothetical protein D3C76_1713750 [compost metagenome]
MHQPTPQFEHGDALILICLGLRFLLTYRISNVLGSFSLRDQSLVDRTIRVFFIGPRK